jgi:hypothetical protein
MFCESGCTLFLTINVLLLPTDPETSTLLDVFIDNGGKVMSVSSLPTHPWIPPHISCLKPGDWMYRLGWRDDMSQGIDP